MAAVGMDTSESTPSNSSMNLEGEEKEREMEILSCEGGLTQSAVDLSSCSHSQPRYPQTN